MQHYRAQTQYITQNTNAALHRAELHLFTQQHYTWVYRSSLTQTTDTALHRPQTLHYTEHRCRITQNTKIACTEQDYTYLYSSVTLNNTIAVLHTAQTQQYTGHKKSITPSRFTLIYASASHLIIQKQFYTEHRRMQRNIKHRRSITHKTRKLHYTEKN